MSALSGVVADIMDPKVLSVRAELPIENLILMLIDEKLQAVPVVDDDRKPIGIASKSDLVFDDYDWAELREEASSHQALTPMPRESRDSLYVEELLRSRTVGDIMSGAPVTLHKETSIIEAARVMGEKRIHGCPVVDSCGRLAGFITTIDIALWLGTRFTA